MLFSSIFDSPRFWDLMENNSNKQGWNIPSVWGVVDKVTNGITDSYTDNEGAHIEVLAVGVTKDDISLKVNGSKVVTLDIKPSEEKKNGITPTKLHKTFEAPDGVYDVDNISAKLENGIFTITFPYFKKKMEKKDEARKIDID